MKKIATQCLCTIIWIFAKLVAIHPWSFIRHEFMIHALSNTCRTYDMSIMTSWSCNYLFFFNKHCISYWGDSRYMGKHNKKSYIHRYLRWTNRAIWDPKTLLRFTNNYIGWQRLPNATSKKWLPLHEGGFPDQFPLLGVGYLRPCCVTMYGKHALSMTYSLTCFGT